MMEVRAWQPTLEVAKVHYGSSAGVKKLPKNEHGSYFFSEEKIHLRNNHVNMANRVDKSRL